MNSRALALVILKLLGIYLLFTSVSWLGTVLQLAFREGGGSGGFGDSAEMLFPASFGLVGLAMATLLLVHTGRVIRVLFREVDFEALESAPDPGLLATGLALIGAWLLAQSIPALVSRAAIILGLVMGDQQSRSHDWWRENWVDVVYFVAELFIGILLVTRNRRLARLASQIEAGPT